LNFSFFDIDDYCNKDNRPGNTIAKRQSPPKIARTIITIFKRLFLPRLFSRVTVLLPQYRHNVASSSIYSAQYGHFFMRVSPNLGALYFTFQSAFLPALYLPNKPQPTLLLGLH